MSSAPSVPGVEVGASWLGGCEHVLTAGALELLAVMHGTFGQRRAELPESQAVRDAEPAGRGGAAEAVQTVLPDSAASKMPRERSATSSPPGSSQPRSR